MKQLSTSLMICIGIFTFAQAGKNTQYQIAHKTSEVSYLKKDSLQTIKKEMLPSIIGENINNYPEAQSIRSLEEKEEIVHEKLKKATDSK